MKYNNILIAPDSFKGGVSSVRFCEIVSEKIKKLRPEAVVRSLPIADGGEGTLECLKISAGGKSVFADTVGPYGEPMKAEILFTKVNEAVIETASCAGLPLVYGRMDPEKTTTAGLGKLIEYAVGHGAEKQVEISPLLSHAGFVIGVAHGQLIKVAKQRVVGLILLIHIESLLQKSGVMPVLTALGLSESILLC